MCFCSLLIIVGVKIKSLTLFLKLKKDIKVYSYLKIHIKGYEKDKSIQHALSEYNMKNFNEIIHSNFQEEDEVDEKKLEDFKHSIDHYFNLYAPGNEDFKEFIKIISIYLTFIVKKPLHPPGIIFSNGTTVYKNGDYYYCTGKRIFIKDNASLCKYCVCKLPSVQMR